MNHHRYKSLGLLFASLYWLGDSLIHKFTYGEPQFELIPSELNELWMRIAIFFMVIVLGSYADHHTKKILQKEREKAEVFNATVSASHHILNNFLNNMQFFKHEAQKSKDFNPDRIALLDKLIQETTDQILKLETVNELTEEGIKKAVYPK